MGLSRMVIDLWFITKISYLITILVSFKDLFEGCKEDMKKNPNLKMDEGVFLFILIVSVLWPIKVLGDNDSLNKKGVE